MAYSILLVDDEPNVLDGYRRQLNSYFDVQTAINGYDGLKLLKNYGPFAAVMVDYVMPGMNGIDFTVNARQAAPETIRLMLTGKGDLQVVSEAVNRGSIFKFLSKPASAAEVLEAVVLAVEKFRGRDYVSDNQMSFRIEGLKLLYRGLRNRARGNLEQGLQDLLEARQVLAGLNDQLNYARVNFLIAGILLENNLPEEAAGHRLRPAELIAEALNTYRVIGFPTLLHNESELFMPALKWAFEHNLDRDFVQPILSDLGSPVCESEVLTIKTLGPMQTGNSGQLIEETDWRNPKVKLFFLYLLTNRHKKIERDIIIEQFWPDMTLRAAGNNFSSTLYSLRQVIGNEKVAYTKGLCWLVKSEIWCDADVFEALVSSARQYITAGQLEKARELFEKAVVLYHGDYLEEYTYEDWVIAERERLVNIYTKALAEFADLMAGEGLYLEAAEALERTPRSEVLDDHFIYRLVNYYILAHSRSKAIRRYQHYRAMMISELGVEPDPSIEKLFDPPSSS